MVKESKWFSQVPTLWLPGLAKKQCVSTSMIGEHSRSSVRGRDYPGGTLPAGSIGSRSLQGLMFAYGPGRQITTDSEVGTALARTKRGPSSLLRLRTAAAGARCCPAEPRSVYRELLADGWVHNTHATRQTWWLILILIVRHHCGLLNKQHHIKKKIINSNRPPSARPCH